MTRRDYLENRFELDHARVDEGEAGVIMGEDGGGGHHCVGQLGGPAEVVQELATDLRATFDQGILNVCAPTLGNSNSCRPGLRMCSSVACVCRACWARVCRASPSCIHYPASLKELVFGSPTPPLPRLL